MRWAIEMVGLAALLVVVLLGVSMPIACNISQSVP